ncbi:MAG: glycosyltransferase [Nocardioidaceae bacterium]
MHEVLIDPVPLQRLGRLLTSERAERLEAAARAAGKLLNGRVVWNVNATAQGGGVAEMLQALLAYGRGAGIDTRWRVLGADPEFFTITKRLHNMLHGSPGDGGILGEMERRHFVEVTQANVSAAEELVKPGDIVLLHDPQTAGMVTGLRHLGAYVVWRCHIGADTATPVTEAGWAFLREFVEPADAVIFSRIEYVPEWVANDKVWVIPPSLDPFSAKNADMVDADVAAALREAQVIDLVDGGGSLAFTRRDGSTGVVRRHSGLVLDGGPVPGNARIVMQVSRWDRLKDMTGVLAGFAKHVDELPDDVHLMLVGPEVSGVSDDPEGAEVLESCRDLWKSLPDGVRHRIHLCCLPMDDVDENAHLVNALQRRATVVLQKSLVEGFGLTVTEPMWKGKPVVASAVGGIRDQIEDGVSGILLADPTDLDDMIDAVRGLLSDPSRAASLGAAARNRVLDRFLGDRHLIQYGQLFAELIAR